MQLRTVWMIALAIVVTWTALAILFAAGLHLCRLPWTKTCYLTFWDGVAGLILFRWAEDPSSLVAASLALAAAILGAYLLNRQIQQSDRHEAERVRRRFRAVRAATPLVLSEVCAFAKDQAKAWLELAVHLDRRRAPQIVPDRLGGPEPSGMDDVKFPELAPSIVSSLKDVVEAANSDAEALPYMVLLNDLQVRVARSRTFLVDGNGYADMVNADDFCIYEVVEAIELYARASNLFASTRVPDGEGRPPVFREDMSSAMYSMDLAYNNRRVGEVVTRLYDRKNPPTVADDD